MTNERFNLLVPAPKKPVYSLCNESNAEQVRHWKEIEEEMGIVFPIDYKFFIQTHGEGSFFEFLEIISPFSPRKNGMLTTTKFYRENDVQDIFPMYPDEGGLLYIGGDENSNSLFWLTQGKPDLWKIVYASEAIEEVVIYRYSLTVFLSNFVQGMSLPPFIDQKTYHYLRKNPVFTPNKIRVQ